jgi:cytoskeleton protein RodZ
MNQVSEALGLRLKAERERKGLSAQKAADDMHLDVSVIEALESDDYARMGPTVYGKGHLKRYADFLGLPVAEILQAFETKAAAPAVAAPASTLHLRTEPAAGGELPWIPLAGVAAALLIAGLLWWKPWHARAGAASAAIAVPAVPGTEPEVAAADADKDAGATPDVGAGTAPATAEPRAKGDAEPTAGLGRARLRLSFSADSWVDVHDAAGVRVFAGKGLANSVKTISGAAPMRVYIGFASGVQLEVNNHAVAIGPQFVAGDVARFEAGADGILRRDAHAHDAPARNPQPHG